MWGGGGERCSPRGPAGAAGNARGVDVVGVWAATIWTERIEWHGYLEYIHFN